MSWYVQDLLRNRLAIKAKADLESDQYNDLLIVEKKIDELSKSGIISNKELALIDFISDGRPMRGFSKDKLTTIISILRLCNKIAFFTGGYFTDEGYLHELKRKYNLTDEQVEKANQYMKSKFKNKLRRTFNEN